MLNSAKGSGLSAGQIFQVLFVLPFVSISNIYGLFRSGLCSEVNGDDNTYYRFLNNPMIPWRKIHAAFVNQFVKASQRLSAESQSQVSGSPRCLICDDSLLEKRGSKIETIGKVFDHCSHKYILGLKLLVLGLWDGKSFIPLDFSIHNEPGKNKNRGLKPCELKVQHSNNRPLDSPAQQRISEVGVSKINIVIQMIKRAIKDGLSAEYVLADSWFISEGFIKSIQSIGSANRSDINVIGLMKTNRIVSIQGKNYKINTLSDIHRTSIKRCKKLNCKYIPMIVTYKGIEMKIFLVCLKGQQNWKVLINTNSKDSFIKSMEIYQIRWSIEVFFKDCKQHLNLGKCQSTNFDAQIATTSLCLMNYIALALVKRVDNYESIGNIFLHLKDIIIKDHIVQKIWNLIITIYSEVLAQLGVDLDLFIKSIIHSQNIQSKLNNVGLALLKLDQKFTPQS